MKRLIVGVGFFVGVLAMVLILGNRRPSVRWVSPVEAHNAEIEAVAMEDRAYPVLAKFVARDSVGNRPVDHLDAMPGDEGWDAVVDWIGQPETQRVIELLEEAAGREVLGVPMYDYQDSVWVDAMTEVGIWEYDRDYARVDESGLMFNVRLPMPATIVRAGWYLRADALVAVEAGDQDRFLRDMQTWARLALFADEPKAIVGQIVQATQISNINLLIGRVLVERPGLIDESMGAALESIFAMAMSNDVFSIDIELELLMLEDIVRRMVDDQGVVDLVQIKGFVPVLVDGEAGVIPEPSSVDFAEIDADLLVGYFHYKAVAQSRVDAVGMLWKPVEKSENENDWGEGLVSTQGKIAKLMFPVLGIGGEKLDKAVSMFRTKHQEFIGVRVALAGHRHWLRHGEPAMGVSDIDTDLLAFDPVDGFTGGAVQYRWVGGRALVYAVGADGDDDGGKLVKTPDEHSGYLISDEYLRERWDGDMVLFPLFE